MKMTIPTKVLFHALKKIGRVIRIERSESRLLPVGKRLLPRRHAQQAPSKIQPWHPRLATCRRNDHADEADPVCRSLRPVPWKQRGAVWFDNIRLHDGRALTQYGYDAKSNYVTTTTNPLGYKLQTAYDVVGQKPPQPMHATTRGASPTTESTACYLQHCRATTRR